MSPTSAVSHLFAVMPSRDTRAAASWYATLFGRPSDEEVGDEIIWEISETAWFVLAPHAEHAGHGIATLAVHDLDGVLERLRTYEEETATAAGAAGSEQYLVETYGNGVRHIAVRDPDGNSLALAEEPTPEEPTPEEPTPERIADEV
ncbi:VOC family protein [Leucobacter sp. CSA1]|uniref:VOC family protein n=1 Tax=Leucobacter chromiisoli TaxID=2796471 RepID=A0A934Q5X8_9MICO|nr:VOC family protein [Leucobacter chromiisoli]MBK0418226.1 VOC family protein [Leucobacter chromiisoli]